MRLTRRQIMLGGLGGVALAGSVGAAMLLRGSRPVLGANVSFTENDMRFFRIGTGSTAGTYYPVGGLLAAAISNPPGSHPCEEGGACGVPGLIAVAQSTEGSVDNVRRMESGGLESALCQADVAYWAAVGEGIFNDSGPQTELRTIASLFPELLHLVVRHEANIRSVKDLVGKRISLDREGSGTRVDALLVLEAFGIKPGSYEEVPLAAGQAAEVLERGELDAFFMVAGTPVPVVDELANLQLINLLPLEGPEVTALAERYPFFALDAISAGTYHNQGVTPTLSVAALWLVSQEVEEELVFAITDALWSPATRILLDSGHPRAQQILLENALKGVNQPPLHPGARAFYEQAGLLPT